jgi:hypothetical protein
MKAAFLPAGADQPARTLGSWQGVPAVADRIYELEERGQPAEPGQLAQRLTLAEY